MIWPFSILTRRRRRETLIREAFERYLPTSPPSPPKKGTIWFLLVQVRDEEPDSGAFKLGEAVDRMGRCDLMVANIMCSAVFATASISIEEASPADEQKIRAAAGQLTEQLGSDIRAVFGKREGWITNIGSSHRFAYGPLFPDFAPLLVALTSTEYGTAREI